MNLGLNIIHTKNNSNKFGNPDKIYILSRTTAFGMSRFEENQLD
jgi:hypothetical protein